MLGTHKCLGVQVKLHFDGGYGYVYTNTVKRGLVQVVCRAVLVPHSCRGARRYGGLGCPLVRLSECVVFVRDSVRVVSGRVSCGPWTHGVARFHSDHK